MRNIYRTLAYASFAITIGSFGIDLMTFLNDAAPPAEPQFSGERGARATKPECDVRQYDATRQRLRREGRSGRSSQVWIGTDPHYDYYYRFDTDAVSCVASTSQGPLVSPYRFDGGREPGTRFAILGCLTVIGLSGAGLVVIRMMREKQLPPPDS